MDRNAGAPHTLEICICNVRQLCHPFGRLLSFHESSTCFLSDRTWHHVSRLFNSPTLSVCIKAGAPLELHNCEGTKQNHHLVSKSHFCVFFSSVSLRRWIIPSWWPTWSVPKSHVEYVLIKRTSRKHLWRGTSWETGGPIRSREISPATPPTCQNGLWNWANIGNAAAD